jgi:hypothetical protein
MAKSWLAKYTMRGFMWNKMIVALLIPPLYAYPSLFFRDQEKAYIEQMRRQSPERSEGLYLSAMVYTDANHWSLWFGNQVVHSTDPPKIKEFQITKVTPYGAVFSWRPPHATAPIRFELCPHQMYLKVENRVVLVPINTL